jgi:hypothetical protein
MTVSAEAAGAPHLVAFTAPGVQVRAILDAAEAVRVRLVLLSAMAGEQPALQLQRLAGELQALGAALEDPLLDGRLSRFGSTLALMAEVFRYPASELAGWCRDVLEVPPRRLARHLEALGAALLVSAEAVRAVPGSAYDPSALDGFLSGSSTPRASPGSSARPCRDADGAAPHRAWGGR